MENQGKGLSREDAIRETQNFLGEISVGLLSDSRKVRGLITTRKYRTARIITIVLLLFIITNPSASAYKELYDTARRPGVPAKRVGRKFNFFVFGVFQCGANKHIGILGNFVKI